MRFRNFIPLLVFASIFEQASALGVGEWSSTTPGGNIIRHDHWTDLITFYFEPSGQKLDSLTKWYFYKDHIVGQYGSHRFFVIDESHHEVEVFDDNASWLELIKSNGLNPRLWKRWYSWDWTYSTSDFKFSLFIALLIGIFASLAAILVMRLAQTLMHGRSRAKKLYFIIPAVLIVSPLIITAIDFLLSRHPQSI